MENILTNLVRIGTVSAVDPIGRKARVIYQDKKITSGWLTVLQPFSSGISIMTDGGHTHTYTGGGETSMGGEHTHTGFSLSDGMPVINQTVLVLYLPVHDGDGFILGAI